MPGKDGQPDPDPAFTPSADMPVSAFRQILWLPLRSTPALKSVGHADAQGVQRWVQFDGDPLHAADPPPAAATPDSAEARYAHYLYFHPYIRRFLFDGPQHDKPPLTRWRLGDPAPYACLDVLLPEGQDAKAGSLHAMRFGVERCLLYEFSVGVVLLELELVWQQSQHPADAPPHRPPLSLADTMDALDFMRRTHPGYFPWAPGDALPHRRLDLAGGRFPLAARWSSALQPLHFAELDQAADPAGPSDFGKRLGDRKSALLKQALEPPPARQRSTPLAEPWASLLGTVGEHCQQIEDERMPYMAYIAVDDPAQISRGDWVRLAFADYRGDSAKLPYGRELLKDFEPNHCYDRFFDPEHGCTTRYLNAGYAFTTVGAYGEKFFGNDGLVHFRRQYASIGLLAQFNKAALLLISNRLSEAIDKRDVGDGSAYRQLVGEIQGDLLEFTHRYWFDGVSNQLQASELQAYWFRHLGLQSLYDSVMAEARSAYDYVLAVEERMQTEAVERLTKGGLWVAVFGLMLAAMGAGFPFDKALGIYDDKLPAAACWLWQPNCQLSIPRLVVWTGTLMVTSALALYLFRLRRPKSRTTSKER